MFIEPKVKTLLIDADILMFRFAFRHESIIQWSEDVSSEIIDEERAKSDIDAFIFSLLKKCDCLDYVLCFTHQLNFRYSILPSYKLNRKDRIPPKLLTVLKQHMKSKHPWDSQPYLEADDFMGILGTKYPNKYVLTTIDKDFKSLPVTLFNWDKDETPKRISEDEADFWFHYQWLIGDPTDGYKGVYRLGDKKARKILEGRDASEYSRAVVETYADKCYSWNEILQQAQMARILRHTDYNFKKMCPILWTPNV